MSSNVQQPSVPQLTETPEEIEYELRATEASVWTGSRLFIGVVSFAFASLAFAYFYLRSSNNEQLWQPHGVSAPMSLGATILALAVTAAILNWFGNVRLRQGERLDWHVSCFLVLLTGLLAIALQTYELTRLSFYPGSSGYASCFVAWAVMNIALLLSSTFWTETLLARSLRLSRALSDEGAAVGAMPADRLARANAEGCTLYWGFVAFVGALFWVFFYVM